MVTAVLTEPERKKWRPLFPFSDPLLVQLGNFRVEGDGKTGFRVFVNGELVPHILGIRIEIGVEESPTVHLEFRPAVERKSSAVADRPDFEGIR